MNHCRYVALGAPKAILQRWIECAREGARVDALAMITHRFDDSARAALAWRLIATGTRTASNAGGTNAQAAGTAATTAAARQVDLVGEDLFGEFAQCLGEIAGCLGQCACIRDSQTGGGTASIIHIH